MRLRFQLGMALAMLLCSAGAAWALEPSPLYKQIPGDLSLRHEVYETHTKDGAKLKLWYFPNDKGHQKLMLLCHNGIGNMGDYLTKVHEFNRIGYSVVCFDYRGYGESSHFPIDKRMLYYAEFEQDLLAVIHFCQHAFTPHFDIYGWGMGASLALGIGWNQSAIVHIIADSPYLSMEHLRERIRQEQLNLGVPAIGYNPDFAPMNALRKKPSTRGKLDKSVFLIISQHNPLVNLDDMRLLQNLQPANIPLRIMELDTPAGGDNFMFDKTAFMLRIKTFLAL